MGDENSQYFDISILLRLGDVNFLKIARNSPSLRMGGYFDFLKEFEISAPKGADALEKAAGLSAGEEDARNLAAARESFQEVGCYKFLPQIDEVLLALKENRRDDAAGCAKKNQEEYSRLQRRILASKKNGKQETDGGDLDDEPLKDALLRLEEEEITRKLRILAVDDAPVMIKTISSVLNETYKVYGMTNPVMLKKFLGQITPDLFLLDYQMPEINGFELVPIIRNFEEHKDTPIIYLTSMGTIDHVSAALKLGACDFIVKPFQGDNLLEKVSKHIVRKKILF